MVMAFNNTASYSTHSVSESTGLRNKNATNFWKKYGCFGGTDGFTVISSCFFVLTVAVTFALVIQVYYGSPEISPHGAVATDEALCSQIGRQVMRNGGSAADVVIASLICLSVTHPHLVGPGGGGVALVHDHKLNKSTVFDFMSGVPHSLENYPKSIDSNDGRSIGIPGFLRGLDALHRRHGKLLWSDLIEPSVSLAKNGFPVSASLWNELSKEQLESGTEMGRIFLQRGVMIARDEILKRVPYARLLLDLLHGGVGKFYSKEGKYAKEVLDIVQGVGGDITENDLETYDVIEREVLQSEIRNRTVVTADTPFGGMQALVGLRFMEMAKIGPYWQDTKLYEMFAQAISYGNRQAQEYAFGTVPSFATLAQKGEEVHKILSAAQKFSERNVEIFFNELPAAQVSAIDTTDFYVSAVVGLGTNFGSRVVTKHEIFLNNHLSNYVYMPSLLPNNQSTDHNHDFVKHLRPFTPYTPMIIMDTNNICGQRIVLASGSSSAITQVASHLLFRGSDMTASIVEPRLSIGPTKEILVNDVEPLSQRLPGEVREYFKSHNYSIKGTFLPVSVNGVSKHGDKIVSHSDTRGGGVAARLNAMGVAGGLGNSKEREGSLSDGVSHIIRQVVSSDPSNIVSIKVPALEITGTSTSDSNLR